MKNKRILFLCPHPDDTEFSAGGSIEKWKQDNEIYVMVFSNCGIDNEFRESMRYYDIINWSIFDFPLRNFNKRRQEILDKLITLKEIINPDIVILPASIDVHQDHKVIYQEGIRAFKEKSILGYEMPWNQFSFHSTYYSVLSQEQINKKLGSLKIYVSQKDKAYCNSDYMLSLATVRGMQVNEKYCETFEIIRWID